METGSDCRGVHLGFAHLRGIEELQSKMAGGRHRLRETAAHIPPKGLALFAPASMEAECVRGRSAHARSPAHVARLLVRCICGPRNSVPAAGKRVLTDQLGTFSFVLQNRRMARSRLAAGVNGRQIWMRDGVCLAYLDPADPGRARIASHVARTRRRNNRAGYLSSKATVCALDRHSGALHRVDRRDYHGPGSFVIRGASVRRVSFAMAPGQLFYRRDVVRDTGTHRTRAPDDVADRSRCRFSNGIHVAHWPSRPGHGRSYIYGTRPNASALLSLEGGRLTDTLLRVEGVIKRFGPLTAVDNVSLAVSAGEVFSLAGANGAGKSTLIRMITGISEPDSGSVFIKDEDLTHRLPSTKRHLGYLPEELVLYERLTGREYLELVAGLKEADPTEISNELAYFELAVVQNKLVGEYSLGMRKKLGLAAAMIGRAELLVLDEPLNGLDVEMMRRLRERIESERSAGRAFVISSHVMSFVERVSDRVGIMRSGKIVAEGAPADLRTLSKLSTAPFEDVFFYFVK
ncbi:MAG: hypothetical protein DMF61_02345 [Blastocatellia bacterium AA13]|nr:MAG: hypothetical protein DMF61_02345 [Blastocatellia bacterium AA13]